jgi:hypothetical protein
MIVCGRVQPEDVSWTFAYRVVPELRSQCCLIGG